MFADYKKFDYVLKRIAKSGYSTVLFHNRMILGCYDPSEDGKIGMHFILHIPDEYGDLYDGSFEFNLKEFVARNKKLKEDISDKRSKYCLPPRAVVNIIEYNRIDNYMEIIVKSELHQMVKKSEKVKTLVPGDEILHESKFSVRCRLFSNLNMTYESGILVKTFSMFSKRAGKNIVSINGLENNLVEKALNCPRIFYFSIKLDKESVCVPLMKSFLRGVTKFKRLEFTIQDTIMKGIYIYTITIEPDTKDSLIEQYVSYIQNFKI